MSILVLAAVTLLASHSADAQKLEPQKRGPLTVRFVNTAFTDIIGLVEKYAGIEVDMDDSATPERRNTKITVNIAGATLEEALDTLTSLVGLSYEVVDEKTVRIFRKP